jgi:hypothetical protein
MLALLVGLLYVQRTLFFASAFLLLYLVGFFVFAWQKEYGSTVTPSFVNFVLQLILVYVIGLVAGAQVRLWMKRGMP